MTNDKTTIGEGEKIFGFDSGEFHPHFRDYFYIDKYYTYNILHTELYVLA